MLLTEEVLISVPLLCPRQETQLCLSSVRLVKVRVGELDTQICSEGVSIIWRSKGTIARNGYLRNNKTRTDTPTSLSQHPSLPINQKYLAALPRSPPVLREGSDTHRNTHTHTYRHFKAKP